MEKPVPLDFTYVVYDSESLWSQALAYLTFLPVVMIIRWSPCRSWPSHPSCGSHVTILLFRRELETAYFFAGVVFNSAVSVITKRIVKQPRPPSSVKTGYGMPSHHTQYMGFFTAYMLLLLSRRLQFGSKLTPFSMASLALLSTCIVAVSR